MFNGHEFNGGRCLSCLRLFHSARSFINPSPPPFNFVCVWIDSFFFVCSVIRPLIVLPVELRVGGIDRQRWISFFSLLSPPFGHCSLMVYECLPRRWRDAGFLGTETVHRGAGARSESFITDCNLHFFNGPDRGVQVLALSPGYFKG